MNNEYSKMLPPSKTCGHERVSSQSNVDKKRPNVVTVIVHCKMRGCITSATQEFPR